MQVSVQVLLGIDEEPSMSATEAAEAILKALGGDEATDFVTITANRQMVTAQAGTPPAPPAPGTFMAPTMMPPPIR